MASPWLRSLEGIAPLLALPTDRARTAGSSSELRARREVTLDAESVAPLDALAARAGADRDAVLLAAFAALLHRYAGEAELIVAARDRDALLARRIDVSGADDFESLLARARDALAQPDAPRVPLDAVAELRAALRREGRATPAHAGFAWLAPEDDRSWPREACVDVALLCEPADDALRCILDYRTDLFDPESIERMLGHLRVLLADACRCPECAVSALSLLTAGERAELARWNDTRAEVRRDVDLVTLVREQAAATPNAVAIEFEGTTITYAELDARANRLGAYLRGRGVGAETLVGLFVDRSPEMIVAILGIHRAGGAYLPIDPSMPPERIAFMLEDSAAALVLTEERLRSRLPVYGARAISLDGEEAEVIARTPAVAPSLEGTPERLTYVIYTSGSTGRPKGVQIEHRNVVNFLAGLALDIPIGAGDAMLALTPLSFDISTLEIFHPLTRGARVVIASRETAMNPKALGALIASSGVTHVQATPSTWRMLLDGGWTAREGLVALCGGEALPQPLHDRLVEQGVRLWNLYGPTEATVWATIQPPRTRGAPVRIGHPMANVRAYVLDAARAQVPVGVTGELYLGGDGLARGYLNRPELTAERFVRAHVDGSGPQRLYRTGDLARWRADGTIEFLGRVDNQVKVRGYRIELGEIEAALDAQPGVRMSAVVVREVAPGDPRLIGYVAVKQDARAEPGALRRALLETLPRYMVPDAVVILDALPLNTSGKIDRKRLPAPPAERSADRLVAPRTPLEERLVTIWEEVLDVRPIGVTDDFFDLGATSITAARLFERIERELGATLPLSPLFQAPTVERLAALIEGGREEKRWTSLVPIQPRGTKTPIFCVHGGAGTILHFQPLARRLGDDQPFYGLQIQGLYGDAPTHRTIEQMATHYLREVRSVQPRGPYVLAGYCFGAIVAFEMTRMLEAAGERVSLLVTFNGPSPAYIRKFGGARHRHPDEASWHIPTPEGLIARAVLAAKRVRWALEREKLAGYWVTLKRRALKYRLNAHAWMYSILQRPLPDSVRERLIFRVCGMAEVRYRPRPIGAPMLLFHGAGLYRDPELGWSGLASRIDSLEVPGEHSNQRSAMHEPFVGFVSEQMQRALVTEQGIGARLTGEAAD